jgi:FAD/FMN-containing dehydrogenase
MSDDSDRKGPIDAFLSGLISLCGDEGIVRDKGSLEFLSLDLFFDGRAPLAAVSPKSTHEIREIVKLCRGHRVAVFARGGGLS